MSACTPKNEKHKNHHKVCVFVASSDNTKDVFRNVIASYEIYWGKCRYPKFVGLNSYDEEIARRFTIMTAPPDGWRAELLEQIRLLPCEITHILLMLDDFLLLSPVNDERLDYLIDKALQIGFIYTRLVPMSSALLFRLIRRLKNRLSGKVFDEIPRRKEYFSSLQPALWNRDHLVAMLELPGTIWEFETQGLPHAKHYAITHTPPIRCVHIVEKGRWMPDTLLRFKYQGLPFMPGGRPLRPSIEIPLLWWHRFKFAIIGYTGVRARRMLGLAMPKHKQNQRSK